MNQDYRAVERILRNGNGLLFAYDHGFEHGPDHFDEQSVEPTFALELANSGNFTGFICQKGIAARYYNPYEYTVPLIVKLNGKTSFRDEHNEDYLALQNCSVEEALSYGAAAVGYVIYVGSKYEPQMIAEFGRIEKEAHEKGLAVLAWMYVAGDDLLRPEHTDIIAYAARVGMELNADGVILRYTGDEGSFRWVVKNAGRAKVFVVGGPRMDTPYQLEDTAKVICKVGAAGFAIGRNVWQSKDPLLVVHKISQELFGEGNVVI